MILRKLQQCSLDSNEKRINKRGYTVLQCWVFFHLDDPIWRFWHGIFQIVRRFKFFYLGECTGKRQMSHQKEHPPDWKNSFIYYCIRENPKQNTQTHRCNLIQKNVFKKATIIIFNIDYFRKQRQSVSSLQDFETTSKMTEGL